MQEEFTIVVTKFLNAGANGIRLSKAPYLLVDKDFANENVGNSVNFTIGQYNFYNHHKTKDQQDLGPLLKTWRDIVKNKTESGPFMIAEDLTTLEPYKVNGSLIIDLPRHSQVFKEKMVSGIQIKMAVDSAYRILEKKWGLWEVRACKLVNENNSVLQKKKLKFSDINTGLDTRVKVHTLNF